MNGHQKRHAIFDLLEKHRINHPNVSLIELVKLLSMNCPTDSDEELLTELLIQTK